MGGTKREELLYLTVTKGKLVNKSKNIEFDGYKGTLVGIRERTGEYEGKPTIRIELKMKDSDSPEVAIIQFTKKAWFALGFFSRIEKIDLSKPFTVGVLPAKENEKMSFCYLKQEGNPAASAEGNIPKDAEFPKYSIVKVSGEDVQDWAAPFARFEAIIKALSEKLSSMNVASTTEPAAPEVLEAADDAPF